MEEVIAKDISIFGTSVTKSCVLDTFRKRLYGAWKVLCGDAGIIFIKVPMKKFYKDNEEARRV